MPKLGWLPKPTALVIAIALVLGACSASVAPFTPPPDESYDAALLEQGRELYLRACAACHARDGGGGVGPNLRQVWERLTPAQHVLVVEEGRGRMPAFGPSLGREAILAIVAYVRAGWADE